MRSPGFKFLNKETVKRMETVNPKKYSDYQYVSIDVIPEEKIIELIYDYLIYHLKNSLKQSNTKLHCIDKDQYTKLLHIVNFSVFLKDANNKCEILYLLFMINSILNHKKEINLSSSPLYNYLFENLKAYQPNIIEKYTKGKKPLSPFSLKFYIETLYGYNNEILNQKHSNFNPNNN